VRIRNLLLAGASAAALAGCSGLPPIGPPSWYASQSFAVRNADGSIYDPATSPPAYAPPADPAPPLYPDWPHQANLTGPEINRDHAADDPPITTAPPAPGNGEENDPPAKPPPPAPAPPSASDDYPCVGYWRICHFNFL
jgi:hypothetical protein